MTTPRQWSTVLRLTLVSGATIHPSRTGQWVLHVTGDIVDHKAATRLRGDLRAELDMLSIMDALENFHGQFTAVLSALATLDEIEAAMQSSAAAKDRHA